jgi:hypothetical protein
LGSPVWLFPDGSSDSPTPGHQRARVRPVSPPDFPGRGRHERDDGMCAHRAEARAVEHDEDYRALYRPGHLCKCTDGSTPQPAMRAVSLLSFIGALIVGATPVSARAQAAGSTTKSTAKSSTPTKTHQLAHAKATKGKASPGHATPTKTAAAPAMTAESVPSGAPPVAPLAPTTLLDAPDGQPFATLSPHVVLEPVARDRGWVRVRAEGWVRESEVAPVDSDRVVLSAADLRADPDGARGKHVRWDVEVLAMATADDPLRKGLNPDEPYLLVRGPGTESALLYVAIPPSLVTAACALASLAPVPIALAATVRVGRSEPVGVPILDAQSLTRR